MTNKYKHCPSAGCIPSVMLTDEQKDNFLSGDGIYLVDENEEAVGFIHADDLDCQNKVRDLQETAEEAGELLRTLEILLSNQRDPVELDPKANAGLVAILADIQQKLAA